MAVAVEELGDAVLEVEPLGDAPGLFEVTEETDERAGAVLGDAQDLVAAVRSGVHDVTHGHPTPSFVLFSVATTIAST